MNIIKLDAIDSTNLFLKDLSKKKNLKNFTTVVSDVQTNGKGQMNAHWHSAKGENLLFTVYVAFKELPLEFSPYISFLSALKIREVLLFFLGDSAKILIKWPNDILSYNQKVAGILVENRLKQNKVSETFIGIGLNVNQKQFPDFLHKATSMALIGDRNYDRDEILKAIVSEFEKVLNATYLLKNKEKIKQEYLRFLYKLNTPSMFKDKLGNVFMAKIVTVSETGLLILEKEDGLQYAYAVKEIGFL